MSRVGASVRVHGQRKEGSDREQAGTAHRRSAKPRRPSPLPGRWPSPWCNGQSLASRKMALGEESRLEGGGALVAHLVPGTFQLVRIAPEPWFRTVEHQDGMQSRDQSRKNANGPKSPVSAHSLSAFFPESVRSPTLRLRFSEEWPAGSVDRLPARSYNSSQPSRSLAPATLPLVTRVKASRRRPPGLWFGSGVWIRAHGTLQPLSPRPMRQAAAHFSLKWILVRSFNTA